jgi:3-hydroxyacyl-CoA dehydrogenase
MIDAMIAEGYTGDKGKGGFYVTDNDENVFVRPLGGAELAPLEPAKTSLPASAIKAAEAMAKRGEPLDMILAGDDIYAQFCRRVLGRVLAYAASLIPAVTNNPQDIDDAMKLGFNWTRGPFELIDAIGSERMQSLMSEAGVSVPEVLKSGNPFYKLQGSSLMIRDAAMNYNPIMLPTGVIRFHMTRRSMTPIVSNNSASLFVLDGFAQSVNDLRLIEFHSKANALNDESMEIVAAATEDHGSGIIVHNDAQHFSAGVDLNAFRAFIEAEDWDGIDKFLQRFKMPFAR